MQKSSIYGEIIFRTLLCSFIAIFLTGALLMWSKYSQLTGEFNQFRENYIELQKENIRQEINSTLGFIQYRQTHALAHAGEGLEEHVYDIYRIAWNLYIEHPDISRDEFKKLLIEILHPIRSYHDNDYHFCIDTSGELLLDPTLPEFEGRNISDWQDIQGKFVVRDMINLANMQSEGFMLLNHPETANPSYDTKYMFVKIFEPFNLVLGAGKRLEHIHTDTHKNILETLSIKRFGKDGENYLFVLSDTGQMLASGGQAHLVGKTMEYLKDAAGKTFVPDMLRLSLERPEGAFVEYLWAKPQQQLPVQKVSFVRRVPEWNVIVGTGIYLDGIDEIAQIHQDKVYQTVWRDILLTVVNFLGLILIVYLVTRNIVKEIKIDFEQFVSFFQQSVSHSVAITVEHLHFTEFRTLADATNQMLLNLKQSEERFNLVIRAADAGIWDWQIDQNDSLWWSPKFLELLGYRRDELENNFSTFMQLIHPEDQNLVYRTTNAHLNQCVPYRAEFRVRHKNGEYKWFNATAQAKWDEQRNPVRMAGSLIDITERKLAEKQLANYRNELEQLVTERTHNLTLLNAKLAEEIVERKEVETALRYSEQRFRDVSNAMGEYIWEIDADGCYTFVSERVEFIKGYKPQELLGHSPIEFMQTEDIEKTTFILQHAAQTKTAFQLQYRNTTKNAQVMWEEVSGVPILDETGAVLGFRGAGLGITERKRVEALLKQHSENLEQLVRERTTELAQMNEQLKTEIHERRQKEKQLRLAQFTMDNSPDAIEWLDRTGKFIYVNVAHCQSLGYSQAELLSMHLVDVDPNLSKINWETMWNNSKQNPRFNLEAIHRRKNDTYFPVEVRSTFLQFDGHEYLCSFIRDLTQRKQAESAQLKRQQTSSLLVEIQHILLLAKEQLDYPKILKSLGQMTEVNRIYVFESGFNDTNTLTQVAEWAFNHFAEPSIQPMVQHFPRWLTQLKQGESIIGTVLDFPEDEQNILRRDGILSVLILPILLNNQLVGLIGFEDSIHTKQWKQDEVDLLRTVVGAIGVWLERKQAEDALEDSKEVFSAIGSAAQDAIIMMDDLGKISYWNAAAAQMFGYSSEYIVGKALHHVITPRRYLTDFEKNFPNFCLTGQGNVVGRTVELTGLNQQHQEFPVEISISSAKIKGKWHAIGIMRDITERKQAEVILKQQNEALIRLNQEKNEFMGIAAHDLKNPLSSILGYAEEIQEAFDELPDAEILEYTKMIQLSAQRMFQLINNLLDVNAIEAGKMNVNLKAVNILPILQSSILYYRKRAHEKSIVLQTGPIFETTENFTAWVDSATLHQILDNLLSNALKYSLPYKKLYIHLYKTAKNIRCEIQDEGPGLSVEDQQKLFSKFTRLTPRPTQGEHSTGLGLYIVKKLVEAMNGKVWCETELGRGATFVIEFPQAEIVH